MLRTTNKYSHVYPNKAIFINSLIALFFLCLFADKGYSQWIQTSGPEGGEVRFIENVGTEVWASTQFGIYKSGNEGATWTSHPQFTSLSCYGIYASEDTVLVIYSEPAGNYNLNYFCLRSLDAGETWNNPVFITTSTQDIPSLKRAGNSIYLADTWPQEFITTDFGLSWNEVAIPYSQSFYLIEYGPKGSIYAAYSYNYLYYILYHKNEASQEFTMIDSLIQPQIFSDYFLLTDSTIFISKLVLNGTDYTNIILRSRNLGLSWDTLNTEGFGDFAGVRLEAENDIVYLGYSDPEHNYFWVGSIDEGETWTVHNVPNHIQIRNSTPISNGEVLVPDYRGVLRYPNSNTNPYYVNTGIRTQKSIIYAHNEVLYSACSNQSYKSVDGGLSWSELPFPISSNANTFEFSGDTIYAAINKNNPYFMRTFNNGNTWDTLALPMDIGTYTQPAIVALNQKLFISGTDSTYFSNDYGLTWTAIAPWLNGGGMASQGEVFKINNQLWEFTNDGSVARLNIENDAMTWEPIHDFFSPGAGNGNKLIQVNESVLALGRIIASISTDNGATWTSLGMNGLPNNSSGTTLFPFDLIEKNDVWYGTLGYNGVYYSTNHGESWQSLEGLSPFVAWGGLVFIENILFSGSYNSSIWRRNGEFNSISGQVFIDFNQNGLKDGSDYNLSGINIITSPQTYLSTTNSLGFYSLYTDVLGDTIRPYIPNSTYVISPDYRISNGNAEYQDFGIYLDTLYHDFTIDLTNSNVFRPGFETQLKLTTKNLGGVRKDAEVRLVLDHNVSLLSAEPTFDNQLGDTLVWYTDSLSFNETNTISLSVYTALTSNLGDSLFCYAEVLSVTGDINLNNNNHELRDIFVGSYDPNDKTCLNGDIITPTQALTDEIEFIIRFQNTGNFVANNVHISDTLSNLLDLTTFRIVAASHDMEYALSSRNTLDFYFNNIFLPDSASNEALSNGFVKYAVKCKSSVTLGNAITNTAFIYFDLNPPITTNTTTTLIGISVAIADKPERPDKINQNVIVVYPNPTSNYFNIDRRGVNSENLEIQLYNLQGMLMKSTKIQSTQAVSIQEFPSGIYIGIITEDGNKVSLPFKIIKN